MPNAAGYVEYERLYRERKRGEGMSTIEISFEIADSHPFDSDDNGIPQIKDADWATVAARAVIADLEDRRDIKQGFRRIDEDIRKEIVETLSEIIRIAKSRKETEVKE